MFRGASDDGDISPSSLGSNYSMLAKYHVSFFCLERKKGRHSKDAIYRRHHYLYIYWFLLQDDAIFSMCNLNLTVLNCVDFCIKMSFLAFDVT